ncbi:carbon-nitrogen hydrolase family protein [Tuwongella immobilis]|uniref:CN hydrolase domain-containing protein n=1 Tax=Tuwongella immobilis TaxID=692036 RepID=A0A6C2YIV2_9BACT|nr:carbon-nitrogen hydrolase family protein [Tuwongella immobilis]VIP01478.1 amidohydrolase : Putative amidohydrolase OS=Arcticibacter svalbardensis MN12-7 GN=ADIARSV_1439 PE=4 SV=1: CN_hydrolase [Tuwongella immobilis]VTR98526.1 amidohydrolase : Putative amidohydrolase OS=Arcticibacter svalbardensis MN12-7 GN=ADIARSV_1439 PE=4 SV=1: CN_hydrolase [Tuwongella immobilis]
MKIALASPQVATSLSDGLQRIERLLRCAAEQGASIVCFPEAYLPGLRGQDFAVFPFHESELSTVVQSVAGWCADARIAAIVSSERFADSGRQIAAYVFQADGQLQGIQTKNQIDPSEDPYYVPGETRQLFQIEGLTFGVAICHEAWRYPETVRWAAVRGAQVVFQPQHTGMVQSGRVPTEWGSPQNAYYEQAMRMRARENTIYFASVNYALPYPESATSVIDPQGDCVAFLPYGQEGVLVTELELSRATGLLASRYAPERLRQGVLRHE